MDEYKNDDKIRAIKSTLVSRNITVLGRRTSVRLEPEMWRSLREIAKREDCKTHDICSLIQIRKNPNTSLTAGIRVFIMLYYRAASTEEGHVKVGHGNFNNMMHRAQMTKEMLTSLKKEKPAALQRDKFCLPAAGNLRVSTPLEAGIGGV